MRRVLALAVLVAFMPTVHAQDKGKSDLTTDAEFRLRDTFMQNEMGNASVKPSHENDVDQRFKLGLGWKANEKFGAHVTLLQSASWGQGYNETIGNRGGANSINGATNNLGERNFMSVNEAYATWAMSENLHTKFGRQNFAFGDGAVMSVNDWEAQPYSFDGVTANYELEFGRFTAFAFKYRNYTTNSALPAANSTTSDPQHDAYGLVFDLKTAPEWLKSVNVHVIQDVGDSVWGSNIATPQPPSTQTTQNTNALRYGVGASFLFAGFDLKANAEMVSGKNSTADAAGTVTDASKHNINASMYQAELGYSLPNLMSSRFHLGYHHDSGTSASDKATKDNTYDGYFHDQLSGSGMMQIVGWGNLTDVSAGWSVKPTDTTTAGLDVHMFSKTTSDDAVYGGMNGQTLFAQGAGNSSANSSIGTEYDLYSEHKYDGGLSMLARLGYFTPGSALKDSVTNKTASITQVMVQGKLTF